MNTKIVAIGAGIVLLLGIGFMVIQNKSSDSTLTVTESEDFGSIKDVLTQQVSMKCEYADEGRETVSYLKNGKIRSDFVSPNPDESGSVIIKDDTMYSWKGNEGIMMKIPDPEDVETPDTGDLPSSEVRPDEVVEDIEKYKEYCKQTSVDDDLFEVPDNVEFTDFAAMMEESMQNLPEGVDQEQIDEMMKQFGQ